MHTEIEAKFLDIDVKDLRKKLKSLGAKLIKPESLMRRKNFDFPDLKLKDKNGWVRVRDEGDRVTLSYKQTNSDSLFGTKEINIIVDNFEEMCNFLETIGLSSKNYQETRRESWVLDNVEVDIDTWPWIPQFVELEGKTGASVKKVASKLGLDWESAMYGSVEVAYRAYFDVTTDEVNHRETITFSEEPVWPKRTRIN